jgi:hypothetical protein
MLRVCDAASDVRTKECESTDMAFRKCPRKQENGAKTSVGSHGLDCLAGDVVRNEHDSVRSGRLSAAGKLCMRERWQCGKSVPTMMSYLTRKEVNHSGCLDLKSSLAKVPLSFEAPVGDLSHVIHGNQAQKLPMQTSNDPIRQSVDVDLNLLVDHTAPAGEKCPVCIEPVNGLFAHLTHKINGSLNRESVLMHHNCYHIVRVTS